MRAAILLTIVVSAAAWSSQSEAQAPRGGGSEAAMTGNTQRHMQNCPTAVASAKTTASRTADGIELTITSRDPAARDQIRARAGLQSTFAGPRRALPQHSGAHGGPGTIGMCPIIHDDTVVTSRPIPDGVRIHIAARDKSQVSQLQQATEARLRRAHSQPAG